MFEKKIIKLIPQVKKWIVIQVLVQWMNMLTNISLIYMLVKGLFHGINLNWILISSILVLLRIILVFLQQKCSEHIANEVKLTLREKLFNKASQLNADSFSQSELVQLAVEGVEQLEIYFAKYLPQFFYSILAPVTLFIIIQKYDFTSALVLVLGVPLIPITIVLIQKIAKKLLGKYWSKYTSLGDHFLDNLSGLNALKMYGASQYYRKKMQEEAESFRKITMRVLIMQLNSISVMDIVAFGGAALGSLVAANSFVHHELSLAHLLFIILVASEFFLPMRLLGSYFHIAMNGIAASEKMDYFLMLPLKQTSIEKLTNYEIMIKDLSLVKNNKTILENISLTIPDKSFIGIMGVSGSGKSSLAKVICGLYDNYQGEVLIGGEQRFKIDENLINRHMLYVDSNPQLFAGSIYDNLTITNANPEMMEKVLKQMGLWQEGKNLDYQILEKGQNLSGGQKQRLNVARALLANRDIYLFDEATANIDRDSEKIIIECIKKLAHEKTVIFISHRLSSLIECDRIYHLMDGKLLAQGNHEELISTDSQYALMYNKQQQLEERYGDNHEKS